MRYIVFLFKFSLLFLRSTYIPDCFSPLHREILNRVFPQVFLVKLVLFFNSLFSTSPPFLRKSCFSIQTVSNYCYFFLADDNSSHPRLNAFIPRSPLFLQGTRATDVRRSAGWQRPGQRVPLSGPSETQIRQLLHGPRWKGCDWLTEGLWLTVWNGQSPETFSHYPPGRALEIRTPLNPYHLSPYPHTTLPGGGVVRDWRLFSSFRVTDWF